MTEDYNQEDIEGYNKEEIINSFCPQEINYRVSRDLPIAGDLSKLQRYEMVKGTRLFKKFLAKEQDNFKQPVNKIATNLKQNVKDQNSNEPLTKDSPRYELKKEPIKRTEHKPLNDSNCNPISKQINYEQKRINTVDTKSYEEQSNRQQEDELTEIEYERPDEVEYEDKRDTSFMTADKELFGVSEQVLFDGSNVMSYSTNGCPPIMPMYPFGMMQPGSIQQSFIPPMPNVFANPLLNFPMQGGYSVANYMTGNGQAESYMKEVQDNSKVINELNEQIKKLQAELKEAKLKIEDKTESKELEEKLKRKDMDLKISEDILRSELDALKKRNEVIFLLSKYRN